MKILSLMHSNQRAVHSNTRIAHHLHRTVARIDRRRDPLTQVQHFHELLVLQAQLVLLLHHVVRHVHAHEHEADDVAQHIEKVKNVQFLCAARPRRAHA